MPLPVAPRCCRGVGALAAAVLLTACTGSTGGPTASVETTAAESTDDVVTGSAQTVPTEHVDDYAAPTLVATATSETVNVYATATATGSPADLTLDNPTETGGPLTLAVLDSTSDDDRLHVSLPVRPNGATGWVDRDQVTLAATPYRVVVELSGHTLTAYRSGQVVVRESIGVGIEPTPTPGGTFYLYELLQPPDPAGPYGPFAFGLSGFSDALTTFAGGDGRLGIHGTNDPASIGADATNGCVRVDNDVIIALAATLPLGTPVEIRP